VALPLHILDHQRILAVMHSVMERKKADSRRLVSEHYHILDRRFYFLHRGEVAQDPIRHANMRQRAGAILRANLLILGKAGQQQQMHREPRLVQPVRGDVNALGVHADKTVLGLPAQPLAATGRRASESKSARHHHDRAAQVHTELHRPPDQNRAIFACEAK
jgi:hypothetical protein